MLHSAIFECKSPIALWDSAVSIGSILQNLGISNRSSRYFTLTVLWILRIWKYYALSVLLFTYYIVGYSDTVREPCCNGKIKDACFLTHYLHGKFVFYYRKLSQMLSPPYYMARCLKGKNIMWWGFMLVYISVSTFAQQRQQCSTWHWFLLIYHWYFMFIELFALSMKVGPELPNEMKWDKSTASAFPWTLIKALAGSITSTALWAC